ncbi:MAG: DUF58 domain-containing protein [Candidatus Rokubacteria bacterium]|nr:DUF58 domain-containing protein [Candidatus Rokubacteria bacterium]MBI3824650.1 DUF58 domain-containing protein [Candidatus Rokubacteria bacterium]
MFRFRGRASGWRLEGWPPEFLRPNRTIRPTREGWWCLLSAIGLGLTAVNSGNNLLYLLESMLLGLIVVSGVLSEIALRRLRLIAVLPDEIYAGRPAILGVRVLNTKRRLPSYSIGLEVQKPAGDADRVKRVITLPRIPAAGERLVTWEDLLPHRGRHRLPGVRVTTRFPFGLFLKAGRTQLDVAVIVFPAVTATGAAVASDAADAAGRSRPRRGRGHDLHNLREAHPGDDPRLVHWRISAKTGVTMTREMEAEAPLDVRIALDGTGRRDPAHLERALSRAASLAVHFLRAGAGVELVGPGVGIRRGTGRDHQRRLLTALALWEPAAAPPRAPRTLGPGAREIRVSLD